MADEITISASIKVDNGIRATFGGRTLKIDQAGVGLGVPGTVTVATGGTSVDLSELTTEGLIYIENLDDTNFVTYGGTTDKPFRINAGEFAMMRMNPGQTLHMVANTAAVLVYVACQEN